MAVGDVYEVVVGSRILGEYCENVFRFRETVGETDTIPAQNLALGFQTAIIPDWAALVSDQMEFACIYARRISPTPGIAFTVLETTVGTQVGEALPTTSAILLSWLTALATKRGRGRTYFSGAPEDSQAGGKLEAGVLAAWQAFGDTLITAIPAGGGGTGEWELAVWSEVDSLARDVIAAVVRTNLATMRSRRQRPGTS